ncbi:MAG: choice-of-anchor A family protein, partial [Oscillospiraceae bacterium]|nr:choice-of-anchor A family protein [Oscillospiraceae bacterium]
MKDFQFVIQNFLKNHEKHKKYIALLLVLSIVVSFAVPFSLIMPAVSMTGELICGMEEHIHSDECYELSCGLEESDEHLHNADCYTLVCDIPEHIHSQECYSDYQEENNFDFENLSPDAINISNVMATDEQGRTLVSNMNGGVDANDRYSKGQLSEVSLLIGDGVEWAANCKNANDVIEAAKRKYFLGIASDFCIFLESNFNPSNADAEGRVAVGGDVNFTGSWNYQIGNGDYTSGTALKNTDNYTGVTDFAHAIANGKIKNINTLSQGKEGDGSYMYPADEDLYKRFVIGSSTDINNCSHLTWPGAVDTLYQVKCSHNNVSPNEVAQFYQADLINFTDTFTWLRQQSEKLSKKTATGTTTFSNGVLTLDGSGVSSDAKTVYFTMNEWNNDIREIRFVNVPDNANLIVNCGGNANIGVDGKDDIFSTYINDTCISRQDYNGQEVNANNNKKSEQILYNFYNATSVFIDANFNGTILAPNADVTSGNDCNGHLSGSLIAKTFTGGLEFGYRPYRGGMEDILGSSMGYTIPVDKFVKDTNQLLAGAKFDIIENYDTENAKIVNSFTSGNDTNYVDIPSKVDFTGGTNYSGGEKFTGTYTIKEVSAPEGYIADTGKPYTVTITEEIQSDGLIETGSGTIPTYIKAKVEFSNGSSFNIELKDTYSYDGSSSKQIRRELTIGDETFYLEIDNGQVSEVSKLEGNPTGTGSVVTTAIITNNNATTEINTAVTVYQTDSEGNQLTDSENNPIPETQTTEVIVTDIPLQEYTIGCIRFMTNDVSQGNLTFYYNGGESKTYNNVPFTTDKDGQLFDLSNLSDLKYDGVVGIAISFDKDVSAVLRIQKNNGSDWGCIFGTDWGSQVSFQANAIQYFNDGTNPANTTTNVSTVTEVVTTSITSVSYFTSYSVSSDVYYYDKYATIIADPSTAQIYPTTTVDSKYYYNPDDIMMMPMPSENLKFENRCGLLFKKVDSNGNPLSGATIKLQQKNGDNYADVADTVWNWTGSSFTIDPVNLDSTEVYRFHEESAPTGYETAPDIYFKKTDTNKILWGYAENNLENNLDLTYDNNRTITMTDTKITGAKV